MKHGLRFLIIGLLLLAVMPLAAQEDVYFPTTEWRTSTPEEQGMDSAVLAQLLEQAESGAVPLHSLIIVRHGYVVLDASKAPFDSRAPHTQYSVTKAIVATLVGIAIDQGYIEGVNQPIWDFFDSDAAANMDTRKAAITIEDLLTHRSGLSFTGTRDETLWLGADDQSWVQFILDRPMMAVPGTFFNYLDSNTHLLSAIIEQATGMSALDYARENLFGPLGIADITWLADPQGVMLGGWGLFLSPYDMAKIGYLYLHNGRWGAQQIVSPAWVEAATTGYVALEWLWESYGYCWLTGQVRAGGQTTSSYAALGMGGQWVIVMPEQDTVIALTGDKFYVAPSVEATSAFAAVKSEGPLPANPAAQARLEAAAAALAAPDLADARPLATTAATVSGQRYTLADNQLRWEAVALEFGDTEAQLLLTVDGQDVLLTIGLDGLYRLNTVTLPGHYPFEPPAETNIALTGVWTNATRFVVTWYTLQGDREWTVSFRFNDSTLLIRVQDAVGTNAYSMRGTPEST